MSLVYSLCILRFKHFARGKKFDALQNVYIPADCQSWRYLSINPYSFAGKELAVNGWPLSDQFNFGVENFCSTCSSLSNKIEVNIKLSGASRLHCFSTLASRFLSIFDLSFYF